MGTIFHSTWDLCNGDFLLIADVVPRPMPVALISPFHHVIFLGISIPFWEDSAERLKVPFDRKKVFFASGWPL